MNPEMSEVGGGSPTATPPTVTVRHGAVDVDGRRIGWVDRWAPSVAQGRGRKWRWVLAGGRFKCGFVTRREAVAALVAADRGRFS